MKLKNLTAAIAEAQRFIERAEALREALREANQRAWAQTKPEWRGNPDSVTGRCPRESGAVQRASMDLTRALSTLRQDR